MATFVPAVLIKVFGLSTNDFTGLHRSMVRAVNDAFGADRKNRPDISIFFPADIRNLSSSSDVLVEVTGILPGPERMNRSVLAASLGRAVLSLEGPTRIVCSVIPYGSTAVTTWTRADAATEDDVTKLVCALDERVPMYQRMVQDSCYCAENAAEMRGACKHCRVLSVAKFYSHQGHDLVTEKGSSNHDARIDAYIEAAQRDLPDEVLTTIE